MDLNFGHGFLPRVGCDSYKAVDRCLGPGDLWSEPLDLPWAIVDAAWAEKDPSVLDPLRGHGTKLHRPSDWGASWWSTHAKQSHTRSAGNYRG